MEGGGRKRCIRLQKASIKGGMVVTVVLSLSMNVEECVNVHSLCFEMRTRVLEEMFLIFPHYGVWGCYRLVSNLLVTSLGPKWAKLNN